MVHRIRGLLKRREAVMLDVNILTLVEESLALLRLELTRRDIQVSTRIKGEPFFITADRVGLLQVLINLIKNSLDAIADSPNASTGKIQIELDFKEYQVNIFIKDNGPGLTLGAETVMATFYTTKVDGLGLGLAICNEVMNEHEGRFTLSNRSDNETGCIASLSLKKRGSEQAIQ